MGGFGILSLFIGLSLILFRAWLLRGVLFGDSLTKIFSEEAMSWWFRYFWQWLIFDVLIFIEDFIWAIKEPLIINVLLCLVSVGVLWTDYLIFRYGRANKLIK